MAMLKLGMIRQADDEKVTSTMTAAIIIVINWTDGQRKPCSEQLTPVAAKLTERVQPYCLAEMSKVPKRTCKRSFVEIRWPR